MATTHVRQPDNLVTVAARDGKASPHELLVGYENHPSIRILQDVFIGRTLAEDDIMMPFQPAPLDTQDTLPARDDISDISFSTLLNLQKFRVV